MNQPKKTQFRRQAAKIMLCYVSYIKLGFLGMFKAVIDKLNNFGYNPNLQKSR